MSDRWELDRTACMQFGVYCDKWPDEWLTGIFVVDGKPCTAEEARAYFRRMRELGYKAIPCGLHICDDFGNCTGIKKT